MVLHAFDKRLLEFIYQLTLHKKLMNSREMAQNITVQGKKVSERTIKRWLKHLKENHYFTYYLSIKPECLGLTSYIVLLDDLQNHELLEIIPYKTYVMCGANLKTNKKYCYVQYLIPQEEKENFEKFWNLYRI